MAEKPADAGRKATDPAAFETEDFVEESYESSVSHGAERLHRDWRALLTTGFFGGLEIGLGLLAYLGVLYATDSHLLAGVAFGIGFIALLLGHSQLFTEDFLLPVTALWAGRGRLLLLLRLWTVTLLMNLAGGFVISWLVATGFPQFGTMLTQEALNLVEAPLNLRTMSLAFLAGLVMTILTRMHEGAETDVAKIIASFAAAFLLAGLLLSHSVKDSLLIFAAIHAEGVVGYGDWLSWFWYVVLLNMLGGLLLVTAPRLVRASALPQTPGSDKTPPSAA